MIEYLFICFQIPSQMIFLLNSPGCPWINANRNFILFQAFEFFTRNFVLFQALSFLQDVCKILVIGAGGLGCELLKDLVCTALHTKHLLSIDF